ncbi:unnamed protein product [Meloidogyne enterolobii]|uniref:Uncharacterized protein n=1 Tax=Meloidogyne enterolobii TaxID=390850 RepID=A0ACB0YNR4_MELEN
MEESNQNISDNNEQKESDESEEILSFESKFCVLLENQNETSSLDKDEDVVDLNLKLKEEKRKKKYNKRKIRKKSLDNEIDELVKLIESKNKLNKELGNEEIEELNNLEENEEEENIIDKLLNINLNILKESTNIVSLNNLESQIKTSFESKLVDVQRSWPIPKNLEFRMIFDSFGNSQNNLIKWFRFWHNETYQRQQQFFCLCYRERRYSDILNIILNNQNPYHLDSLLLMADLIQNEGNNERANDFIERGIFALETAFHPNFNLCSSTHRLNYSWKENRPFFLLFYRYLLKNIQKNNLKISLEIAKLLFSKDFEGDPLGILLLIDSLAIRANCPNFLLDFYEYFLKSKRLDLLPNFRFSISLALNLLGMEDEAVRNEALVAFPFILSQILDFLQIRADPLIESNYYLNTLASYREPEGLLLLVRIYLHHSNKIWSDPVILNWLEITTHKVLPRLQSVRKKEMDQWAKKRKQLFTGLPENIARHCLINGLSIPETLVIDAKLNLGGCIQINPCPPKASQQEYVDKEVSEEMDKSQQNNLNERNFGLIVSFLRSILPQWILEILCRFIQRFIQ